MSSDLFVAGSESLESLLRYWEGVRRPVAIDPSLKPAEARAVRREISRANAKSLRHKISDWQREYSEAIFHLSSKLESLYGVDGPQFILRGVGEPLNCGSAHHAGAQLVAWIAIELDRAAKRSNSGKVVEWVWPKELADRFEANVSEYCVQLRRERAKFLGTKQIVADEPVASSNAPDEPPTSADARSELHVDAAPLESDCDLPLSSEAVKVLLYLESQAPKLRLVVDIATGTRLAQATVKALLTSFLEDGLAERPNGPRSRKGTKLTEKGMALAKRLKLIPEPVPSSRR